MADSISSRIVGVIQKESDLDARLHPIPSGDLELQKLLKEVECLLEDIAKLRSGKEVVADADTGWLADVYGKWRALYFSLSGGSFHPKADLGARGIGEVGLKRRKAAKHGDLQLWLQRTSHELALIRARRAVVERHRCAASRNSR